MIYLLYGEDVYGSEKLLGGFRRRFFEKTNGMRGNTIDLEYAGVEDVCGVIGGGSLFNKTNLVVFRNTAGASHTVEKLIESSLDAMKVSGDVYVFHNNGVPTGGLFNQLAMKSDKKQEFKKKTSGELMLWIKKEARARGVAIRVDVARALIVQSKGDRLMIVSELEKMFLGGEEVKSNEEIGQNALYEFADFWGRKEKAKCVAMYEKLLSGGIMPDRIFWTLAWHIKNLFLVTQGRLKAHPFVVKKTTMQARNFTPGVLGSRYRELADLDVKSKTGQASLETGILLFLLRS